MQIKGVPKKERYSDRELEEFRILIERKLKQAQKELSTTLKGLSITNSNIASDKVLTLEESYLVEEQEHLSEVALRLNKFIGYLKAALQRIENKTYGICKKTHRLIDKDRLKLVPHTTSCATAKNQRNE